MNIGIIRKTARQELIGRIDTLDLNVRVALRRVLSNNPDAPAYDVMASRDGRNWVKLGAVWAKNANATGEVFYVGSINDPSMTKPMRIALFGISKGEDAGGMAIVWDNGQNRQAATAEGEAAPAAQDGLGDSTAEQEQERQFG
jgi:uncharacterized protein (DUF736 family)